jgi:ATP-dependent RNA helicase DHX37/DHR1
MTKLKNRYNKKQKTSNKPKNEEASESNLKSIVQIEGLNETDQLENDSNMLVLPGNKNQNKEKSKPKNEIMAKKLSKRQRKNYEKIVDKKEKSLKRDELLEELAKYQVKQEELRLYTSVKDIGKKEKRKFEDEQLNEENGHIELGEEEEEEENNRRINSISGANKKRRNDNDAQELSDEIDTDSYSTDEEIDNKEIEAALQAREKQKKETLMKSIAKITLDQQLAEEKLKEEERKANLIGIDRKSCYIHVERSEEVKEMRAKLPIITEEQLVMEKIFENPIVIVCGETGSGKTTQVPQFLYEAGFAEDNKIIGITEPRRIAAISMSKRVAHEMNLSQEVVSYQIRYETNVSPKTKIKFMTDGVLLKEIQKDFLLSQYSVITIDEAHERSVK